MQYFIVVISVILALASAKPTAVYTPTYYTAPFVSQYHSQDQFGQYAYGYSGGHSAKTETKTIDGVTRGAYSYVDAEGKLQSVEYTADAINGFRAAATNLPRAPVDTAIAPVPVEDTPEVIRAKLEHLKAFKEVEERREHTPEIKEYTATHFVPTPVVYKTHEHPLTFSYSVPATYAYNYATPYFASHYTTYPYVGAPYVRTYPLEYTVPKVPAETPEVAKARAEHLAKYAEEKARTKTME